MAKLGIQNPSFVSPAPTDPPPGEAAKSDPRASARTTGLGAVDVEAPDPTRALSAVSATAGGGSRGDPIRALEPAGGGVSMRGAMGRSTTGRSQADPPITTGGRPSDIPDILLRTDNIEVVNGNAESAGDFYCEHAFFVALGEAHRSGSSVVRNEQGEPLVGFLHVPPDPYCDGLSDAYSHAENIDAAMALAFGKQGGLEIEADGTVHHNGALETETPPDSTPRGEQLVQPENFSLARAILAGSLNGGR